MNTIFDRTRCAVLLEVAIGAQLLFATAAMAQDAERIGAVEEDLRPEQPPGTGPAPVSADADTDQAAEAIDFATTAEGGVPAQAAPSDVAVDAVQASMTR
ncbi:MAG TPA: hypothetical protein VLS88_21050, partial [Polyangiales bacterium]|nr:hypothetical protein [Polyangiales bacterium]